MSCQVDATAKWSHTEIKLKTFVDRIVDRIVDGCMGFFVSTGPRVHSSKIQHTAAALISLDQHIARGSTMQLVMSRAGCSGRIAWVVCTWS